MADETVTTWTNLMRETRGPLVEALQWSTVLMSEIERDQSPERFDGTKVKMPLVLAPQQGTGMMAEGGTLNTPKVIDTTVVNVDSGIVTIPVSFSTKVIEASRNTRDTSWASVIPEKMELAEEAFRRVINEQFNGDGTALIAAFTAGATSATQTVGASANFYQLYVDRYVDLLTRATGVPVASGSSRKIIDNDDVNGTVTFDASITVTAAEGIYIEGSYGQALQGFGQATGTTGTFETIARASFPQFKGTDVTPAALSDPTLGIMDKAERKAAQRSGKTPTFYWGDPAVIDKFEQALTVQARWSGDAGVLQTGWEGVKYRNKVFIREYDAPANTLFGTYKEDVRLYARDDGPSWDEKDGSMFKRFSRSLNMEAWLVWMPQLGFKRCNSQVKIGNLTQAT